MNEREGEQLTIKCYFSQRKSVAHPTSPDLLAACLCACVRGLAGLRRNECWHKLVKAVIGVSRPASLPAAATRRPEVPLAGFLYAIAAGAPGRAWEGGGAIYSGLVTRITAGSYRMPRQECNARTQDRRRGSGILSWDC